MNLTAAATSALPPVSKDISAATGPTNVDDDATEIKASQTIMVSGPPTKDEAIDMIQAARWWSPDLTCNPEPLSTLLSNNAKLRSGWLRNLLFPITTTAAGDSNQYQQDLTLTYLLTFAESKGFAREVGTAWGVSLDSAIEARKATVDAAGIYYPVNKVICDISSKGRDELISVLEMYPDGCLRPTWNYSSVDRIQVSAHLSAL